MKNRIVVCPNCHSHARQKDMDTLKKGYHIWGKGQFKCRCCGKLILTR